MNTHDSTVWIQYASVGDVRQLWLIADTNGERIPYFAIELAVSQLMRYLLRVRGCTRLSMDTRSDAELVAELAMVHAILAHGRYTERGARLLQIDLLDELKRRGANQAMASAQRLVDPQEELVHDSASALGESTVGDDPVAVPSPLRLNQV